MPFFDVTTLLIVALAGQSVLLCFLLYQRFYQSRFPTKEAPPPQKSTSVDDSILQKVFDSVPMPIFCKDIDDEFRYVLCNRSWKEYFGSNYMNLTDYELFPPEVAKQFRSDDVALVKSGKGSIEIYEESCHRSDGAKCCGKALKQIVKSAGGHRLLLGIAVDLTDEYLLREKIAFREELLQTILDNVPACIMAKDPDDQFRYVIWNKEVERLLSIPREEIIGRDDYEVTVTPGITDLIRKYDEESTRVGEVRFDFTCNCRDGVQRIFKTCKRCLETRTGKKLIIDLGLDVTREQELKLQTAETIAYQKDLILKAELGNECLLHFAETPEPDAAFDHIFQQYGTEFEADQVYVYLFDSECKIAECAFDWNAPDAGDNLLTTLYDRLDFGLYPITREKLLRFDEIVVDDIDDIDECRACKPLLRALNILSILILPLKFNEQLRGFVGLHYTTQSHVFSESDVRAVRTLAGLVEVVCFQKNPVGDHSSDLSKDQKL